MQFCDGFIPRVTLSFCAQHNVSWMNDPGAGHWLRPMGYCYVVGNCNITECDAWMLRFLGHVVCMYRIRSLSPWPASISGLLYGDSESSWCVQYWSTSDAYTEDQALSGCKSRVQVKYNPEVIKLWVDYLRTQCALSIGKLAVCLSFCWALITGNVIAIDSDLPKVTGWSHLQYLCPCIIMDDRTAQISSPTSSDTCVIWAVRCMWSTWSISLAESCHLITCHCLRLGPEHCPCVPTMLQPCEAPVPHCRKG